LQVLPPQGPDWHPRVRRSVPVLQDTSQLQEPQDVKRLLLGAVQFWVCLQLFCE
jgi:hypothetical protein